MMWGALRRAGKPWETPSLIKGLGYTVTGYTFSASGHSLDAPPSKAQAQGLGDFARDVK